MTQKIEELQEKSTKNNKKLLELTQKTEELQEESTKDKKELENLKDQMNS